MLYCQNYEDITIKLHFPENKNEANQDSIENILKSLKLDNLIKFISIVHIHELFVNCKSQIVLTKFCIYILINKYINNYLLKINSFKPITLVAQ